MAILIENIVIRLARESDLGFQTKQACALVRSVGASGRKWPQVAASGRWPQGVSRASAGQPLAATCSHSSGRKWPQVEQVAGSGSNGGKWSQVAAWIAHASPDCSIPQHLEKERMQGKS